MDAEERFENLDWAKLRAEAKGGCPSAWMALASQVILLVVMRPEDVPVVGHTGCVHVEFELGGAGGGDWYPQDVSDER
jgi:hypothetical protein